MLDLLTTQLTDPFRAGLILALFFTMLRTRQDTGIVMPLLAGIVFVAVIIPNTMGTTAPMVQAIGIGIIANAVLVGIVLGIWKLVAGRDR
jgi:hypothetical protein